MTIQTPQELQKWLDLPVHKYAERTHRDYLFFLLAANGGWVVEGWGFVSYSDGHQRGLEQNDAISLIRYESFFLGLAEALDWSPHDELLPDFQAYLAEQERLRQEADGAS